MNPFIKPFKLQNIFLICVFVTLFSTEVRANVFSKVWYENSAKSNLSIGNYKAAAEAYVKLILLEPTDFENYLQLGICYEKQGLTDQAIQAYEDFIKYAPKTHPQLSRIHFLLAQTLSSQNYQYREQAALENFKKALELEPRWDWRYAYAKALVRQKKMRSLAVAQYEILVTQSHTNTALNPSDKETLKKEYRDLLSWDDDHLDEAIEQYEKEIKINPTDLNLVWELARLYARHPKQKAESLKWYKLGLTKDPNSHQNRIAYINAAASVSADSIVLTELDKLPDRFLSKSLKVLEADTLSKDPDTRNEAIKLFVSLVDKYPKDTSIRLKLARLYAADYSTLHNAENQYNTVLRQDKKNGRAHFGLSKAYAWQKLQDKSVYHLEQAQKYGYQDSSETPLQQSLKSGRENQLGLFLESSSQRAMQAENDYLFEEGVSGIFHSTYNSKQTIEASLNQAHWETRDSTQGAMSLNSRFVKLFWGMQLRFDDSWLTEAQLETWINGESNRYFGELSYKKPFSETLAELEKAGFWGLGLEHKPVQGNFLVTQAYKQKNIKYGGITKTSIFTLWKMPTSSFLFEGKASLGSLKNDHSNTKSHGELKLKILPEHGLEIDSHEFSGGIEFDYKVTSGDLSSGPGALKETEKKGTALSYIPASEGFGFFYFAWTHQLSTPKNDRDDVACSVGPIAKYQASRETQQTQTDVGGRLDCMIRMGIGTRRFLELGSNLDVFKKQKNWNATLSALMQF